GVVGLDGTENLPHPSEDVSRGFDGVGPRLPIVLGGRTKGAPDSRIVLAERQMCLRHLAASAQMGAQLGEGIQGPGREYLSWDGVPAPDAVVLFKIVRARCVARDPGR